MYAYLMYMYAGRYTCLVSRVNGSARLLDAITESPIFFEVSSLAMHYMALERRLVNSE